MQLVGMEQFTEWAGYPVVPTIFSAIKRPAPEQFQNEADA